MVYVIAILIGMLAAFLGSLVGLGGGIILVPILLFLHEVSESFAWATPQTIVGISLITMVFTGLSSTIAYYKQKRVDVKTGAIFLSGSIPGGILGSWLNQYVNADVFSLYFGFLMLFISALFFIDREKLTKRQLLKKTSRTRTFQIDGQTYEYTVSIIPAFIISLFIGCLSGLFGIGGGTIAVPAMILVFGIPVQIAIATSMFMIFFISLISTATHVMLGHVIWGYAIFFMVGAYIGGTLGAKTNSRLQGKTLEWILRIMIIFVAVRLIIVGIS